MKLTLNSSIAKPGAIGPAISGGAQPGKSPASPAGSGDGILISSASAALNQLAADRSARISRITASVQQGLYRTSSSATSKALVVDALSGLN
jgi:hypothetical protein